jgi:hypothetical protein
VKFSAVEQFPLDLFARLQSDGGSQREGKAHIQSGILATGADRLNPQGIGGLHFVLIESIFDGLFHDSL